MDMWDEGSVTESQDSLATSASAPSFWIIDAVYGPPLSDPLPPSMSHQLRLESQRRVVPQILELLHASRPAPLFLPAGSLNSVFGDPAPLVTKELRVAVVSPTRHVHVATFSEVSFTKVSK
jgi:hypothetical protein